MPALTTAETFLTRLRAICLALPGAREVVTHGHPAFTDGKRIFTVLEVYRGELSLCVKVGLEMQGVFLADPRFYLTPYIGKQGWVSLKVHAAPIRWKEIAGLVKGSHKLIGQATAAPRKRAASAKA